MNNKENPIRIATRGSALALWQANHVADRLKAEGIPSELVILKTTGDIRTDVALSKVGGKGLFTKELENALLEGRADIAVHSMKDVPTELPPGLTLGAMLDREDPRDVLLFPQSSPESSPTKTLGDLAEGAVVGTSSLRRCAQLLRHRPDLKIKDLRGNVDTRLRKLDEGQYDAILLAAAGMKRMGYAERINEFLDPAWMIPAVGQGSVGIEIREGDAPVAAIAAGLNHTATRRAVEAERALLHRLEGGCQVPMGIHATCEGDTLTLNAIVLTVDGKRAATAKTTGTDPAAVAEAAFESLASDGVESILEELRSMEGGS